MSQPTPKSIAGLDPNSLQLMPLGIGNAFTSRYYNSSFLLFLGGKTIMVDAPAPLSRVMRETRLKSGLDLGLDNIDTIILTHLHGDHCNGLEELGFWRKFLTSGHRPRLVLLESLVKPLWDNRLSAAMGPEFHVDKDPATNLETYFDVQGITCGPAIDFGVDGARLEAHMTQHMLPCFGFRLHWQGVSIGYSADTAFYPALIDFLSPCDLIIHEMGLGKGHTPLADLMTLPREIRTKMRLTHIADDYDTAASPIPVLEEARLYDVTRMVR